MTSAFSGERGVYGNRNLTQKKFNLYEKLQTRREEGVYKYGKNADVIYERSLINFFLSDECANLHYVSPTLSE